MRTLAVLLALIPAARAQDPSELQTRRCKRGALLWHEKFEGDGPSKEWSKGKGTWAVEAGVLKGAERPEDKHQAYTSRKVGEPNAVLQFSFKFDGARLIGAFFDGKWDGKANHIGAVSLSADSIRLYQMPKWTLVGSANVPLNDGKWHTLVWEVCGDEMVATVDDKHSVTAKVEGLAKERDHLELNTRGGPWALFKDVKVWKAEPKKE